MSASVYLNAGIVSRGKQIFLLPAAFLRTDQISFGKQPLRRMNGCIAKSRKVCANSLHCRTVAM